MPWPGPGARLARPAELAGPASVRGGLHGALRSSPATRPRRSQASRGVSGASSPSAILCRPSAGSPRRDRYGVHAFCQESRSSLQLRLLAWPEAGRRMEGCLPRSSMRGPETVSGMERMRPFWHVLPRARPEVQLVQLHDVLRKVRMSTVGGSAHVGRPRGPLYSCTEHVPPPVRCRVCSSPS